MCKGYGIVPAVQRVDRKSSARKKSRSRWRFYKKTLLDMVRRILSCFFTALTERLRSFFCWCPSSRESLDEAERRVLGSMRKRYNGYYVDVGRISDIPPQNSCIWTVQVEPDEEDEMAVPLVLVHGYLCGAALWVLNLEALSHRRRVYAIDLLGFGKSSRPTLSSDPEATEAQLALALERWRSRVGLEQFVLLGHSFGAFVASAYALRSPRHVAHLILEDPWGFSESHMPDTAFRLLPWLATAFTRGLKYFSRADICSLLRAGGILGPTFLGIVLAHETNMFRKIVQDKTAVVSYFYHCNVRRPRLRAMFIAAFRGLQKGHLSRSSHNSTCVLLKPQQHAAWGPWDPGTTVLALTQATPVPSLSPSRYATMVCNPQEKMLPMTMATLAMF
ncbi:(Lyso)-N-acylphosphatidylethanolamine lipase isoform X2 [Rhipicephalus microplus]|uniref:(Lyso)-N-acylphosphatidylethanolamine lipase isoform X2 n=1 Tax=Rhipicephalus microplus TaxID=6941 RepID=UPI003F6CB2CC